MKKRQRVGPVQKWAGTQVGPRGGRVVVGIAGLGPVSMYVEIMQRCSYRNVFPLQTRRPAAVLGLRGPCRPLWARFGPVPGPPQRWQVPNRTSGPRWAPLQYHRWAPLGPSPVPNRTGGPGWAPVRYPTAPLGPAGLLPGTQTHHWAQAGSNPVFKRTSGPGWAPVRYSNAPLGPGGL